MRTLFIFGYISLLIGFVAPPMLLVAAGLLVTATRMLRSDMRKIRAAHKAPLLAKAAKQVDREHAAALKVFA